MRGPHSPAPLAKAEPLVACCPVRELTRIDHDTDSLRRSLIRGRVRFHRPSAHREDERGGDPGDLATTAGRRRLLSGVYGHPRQSRDHREVVAGAHRSRPSHPLPRGRSEEHTSELQSRLHLVCRLLLEKKKKKQHITLWKLT